MSSSRREPASSARQVHSNIRRVAFGATVLASILYLIGCLTVDVVAVHRLYGAIDARLSARLGEAVRSLPPSGPIGPIGSYRPEISGDLDDAPIVLWWVPPAAKQAVPLETNSPPLPAQSIHDGSSTNATIAGSEFRLQGMEFAGGRLIAGTSAEGIRSAWSTFLVIEGVLLPVVLLSLYIAAWIIGRRAASPVERARRRQLEFTADASHELRTPLSVIEAEVGLALTTANSSASYRGALERVADESRRLRDIVEDLLWLARIDALPSTPPEEAVDLLSTAQVCTDRFQAVAARRAILLGVLDQTSDAPVVMAPADWLDRLVSVLLDNACRYANDGGRVQVSVSTTRDRVFLAVEDSGPGIADEDREHIFERFRRASPVPGGAGLGLSIANSVVRATGGEWEVGTSPLGGAKITLSWHRARIRGDFGTTEIIPRLPDAEATEAGERK